MHIQGIGDFAASASHHLADVTKQDSLFVTVYRMALASRADIGDVPRVLMLNSVAAILYWGQLSHLPAMAMQWRCDEAGKLHVFATASPEVASDASAFLLLVSRYPSELTERAEAVVKSRIAASVGLISLTLGENTAYEVLSEYLVDLSSGAVTGYGTSFRNPGVAPPPRLDESGAVFAESVARALSHRPELEPRANLALRWYRDALQSDGVDALLKAWIAIEVLTMDTADIAPVVAAMAKAHEISNREAKAEFEIGRLCGLRSNIVHNGYPQSIDFVLGQYTACLFSDLLLVQLNLPTRGFARAHLKVHGERFRAALAHALRDNRSDAGT